MNKRVGDMAVGGWTVIARDDKARKAWLRTVGVGCIVQRVSYDAILKLERE